MRWHNMKRMKQIGLWLWLTGSLTACSPISGNQYFCPPTITYNQDGVVRKDVYGIDRVCYKSMTEKMKACYTEAR